MSAGSAVVVIVALLVLAVAVTWAGWHFVGRAIDELTEASSIAGHGSA